MTVTASQLEELARVATPVRMSEVSFAEFYAEHWSDVAGFASAYVGSTDVGDELAQEAFVRLYARYPLVREPRPYVFRITANLARRHHGRRREASLDLLAASEGDPGSGSRHGALAAALDVRADLLDAVRRLPDRLRVIVLLHYFADLSVAEVARALRRPDGTVKRQLSEARAVLAEALADPASPGGTA